MQFEIYMTEGCHLCDAAIEMIAEIQPTLLREINPIDIAYNDELLEQYQMDIPVLVHLKTQQQLKWPFEQAELKEWMKNL